MLFELLYKCLLLVCLSVCVRIGVSVCQLLIKVM